MSRLLFVIPLHHSIQTRNTDNAGELKVLGKLLHGILAYDFFIQVSVIYFYRNRYRRLYFRFWD